ncbi:MAG: DUF2058 domain-containing protein [Gammaproteobacteria bacterium]|nr:DUF2058 domain-containing protein [Gammaproteobacteria bacterium]
MSKSLQDQLLKAGLTTEKKIKKQKQAKQKQKKNQKKGKSPEIDESKLLVQQAEAEKRQRDRALNQQKEDAIKQKAIVAQIKQLIEINSANLDDGETTYNFEDNKVIRNIYVTDMLHKQISQGKYAIVKFDDKYHAVPSIVAEKIKDRDPAYIIVLNDSTADNEEVDEEYAAYEIPDDLMW